MNQEGNRDIIREVVVQRFDDALNGTEREKLNYVDVLYPGIETLFGIEACSNVKDNPDALRKVLEEEYNSDIDYETLKLYFEAAANKCKNQEDEKQLIKLSDSIKESMSAFIGKIYQPKGRIK